MNKNRVKIDVGWQRLTVASVERQTARTDTPMLYVTLKTKPGQTFRQGFAITKKGIILIIQFMATLLERQTMQDFRPKSMVGKSFSGRVEINEKGFFNLAEWRRPPVKRTRSVVQPTDDHFHKRGRSTLGLQ